MKNVKFLPVIIFAVLAVSCEKQNVRLATIINENGTCTREVSYSNTMPKEKRDSIWAEGEKISLPIPECVCVDSSMTSKTEIDKDTVTTTFSRTFSSVEEMSQNTPLVLNGEPLKAEAHLDKNFRWFYTEYIYTETFKSIGEQFKVNPEKYADEEVVSFWFTGQPNLIEGMNGAEVSEKLNKMESLFTKWFNDNTLSLVLDYIEDNYDLVQMAAPSKEEFSNMRDSLTNYISTDLNDNNVIGYDAKAVFCDFFHTDAFSVFFDEETPCGKELNDLLETQYKYFFLSVTYTVKMPGTVTDTGFGTLHDGVILYPLTGERLIPHDYTITATSLVVNVWAYIVSILVIAVAIGSFLIKRRKK